MSLVQEVVSDKEKDTANFLQGHQTALEFVADHVLAREENYLDLFSKGKEGVEEATTIMQTTAETVVNGVKRGGNSERLLHRSYEHADALLETRVVAQRLRGYLRGVAQGITEPDFPEDDFRTAIGVCILDQVIARFSQRPSSSQPEGASNDPARRK